MSRKKFLEKEEGNGQRYPRGKRGILFVNFKNFQFPLKDTLLFPDPLITFWYHLR